MVNKIINLILVLVVFTAPMVLAEEWPIRINLEYYQQFKDCVHSGGTWIFDSCSNPEECPYYHGHCQYPQQDQVMSTGSSGNDHDDFCNMDTEKTCNLELRSWRLKDKDEFQLNDKTYRIDYMGWSFPFFKQKIQVGVFKVYNEGNKLVFWDFIKAGEEKQIDSLNINLFVNGITLNKADIALKNIGV